MSCILVTRSDGFIGRALVKRLRIEGHIVKGFDLNLGDISQRGFLSNFSNETFQHIFHLAGKTFVPDSWKHPAEYYQVNLQGTIQVLELCRKSNARLTHIGSFLYGRPEYLPIDENHPIKAINPYSHSKILAD